MFTTQRSSQCLAKTHRLWIFIGAFVGREHIQMLLDHRKVFEKGLKNRPKVSCALRWRRYGSCQASPAELIEAECGISLLTSAVVAWIAIGISEYSCHAQRRAQLLRHAAMSSTSVECSWIFGGPMTPTVFDQSARLHMRGRVVFHTVLQRHGEEEKEEACWADGHLSVLQRFNKAGQLNTSKHCAAKNTASPPNSATIAALTSAVSRAISKHCSQA